MDLTGKVAIVTGGSRGIGKHLALELGRRGARVVLAVRTLGEAVEETVAAIAGYGSKSIAVQTDVTREEDLRRLVEKAADTFGRVDILVNCAADIPGEVATIDTHTLAGWRRQFDTNLHAPFILMGLVAPYMRKQGGGVIINLTSGAAEMNHGIETKPNAALLGGPVLGYGTTKAALNRLTNLVAYQLRGDRISVVAVNPGFTRTEYVDGLINQGKLATSRGAHSMDLPVATIMDVVSAKEPLEFSGRVIRAIDRIPDASGDR